MRFQRRALLAWFHWAKRKRRLNGVKQYLRTNLCSSHKRTMLAMWRRRTKVRARAQLYQADKLMNGHTAAARLVATAVAAWTGDTVTLMQMRVWQVRGLRCPWCALSPSRGWIFSMESD